MIALVLAVAGLLLVSFALLLDVSAHGGHPQKKLFAGRWYQQVSGGDYDQWMTLSTNEFLVNFCLDTVGCESRWLGPANEALGDWNSTNTTIRVQPLPGVDPLYDLHLIIDDDILGDPTLLGLAVTYDSGYNFCFECETWYGDVILGDSAHSGPYAAHNERRGTVAHEMGHLFALRHESTNNDESAHYPCGEDNTGPIPQSVMSYDCIDPVSLGGLGLYDVQPWDVCGVNHAYFDPAIGYAGCEDFISPTPTPSASPTATASPIPSPTPSLTPAPVSYPVGDISCDDEIGTDDVRASLELASGLAAPDDCGRQTGCVDVGGICFPEWADVNCDLLINGLDSLWILLHLAGNTPAPPDGCAEIGTYAPGP